MKLLICTPELSSTLKSGANKSKYASNNDIKIVCLGESKGCVNLFDLLENVDENEASDPAKVDDASNDNLIIFWSSGTTGMNTILDIFLLQKHYKYYAQLSQLTHSTR